MVGEGGGGGVECWLVCTFVIMFLSFILLFLLERGGGGGGVFPDSCLASSARADLSLKHSLYIYMYVYFLCGLVCICIHESDAELICMCFSQTF